MYRILYTITQFTQLHEFIEACAKASLTLSQEAKNIIEAYGRKWFPESYTTPASAEVEKIHTSRGRNSIMLTGIKRGDGIIYEVTTINVAANTLEVDMIAHNPDELISSVAIMKRVLPTAKELPLKEGEAQDPHNKKLVKQPFIGSHHGVFPEDTMKRTKVRGRHYEKQPPRY